MPTLDTIRQAIAFIEDHLRVEVGIGDIADAVGYSLYHFSRTFNAVVCHTPYDYLMRRRLSESAHDLLASDRLIIDIAYDYCFANPETYTRAFRRMFGLVPSAARSRASLPYRTAMPRLTSAHLAHRTGTGFLPPQLITLPRLSLAALMTLLPEDNTDDIDTASLVLWRLLAADLAAGEVAPEDVACGADEDRQRASQVPVWAVLRYLPEPEHGRCLYAAAVEVASPPPLVSGLTVPAKRYVRFELDDASRERLALARDYVAYTWLPRAGHGNLAPLELLAYPALPVKAGVRPAVLYMALQ